MKAHREGCGVCRLPTGAPCFARAVIFGAFLLGVFDGNVLKMGFLRYLLTVKFAHLKCVLGIWQMCVFLQPSAQTEQNLSSTTHVLLCPLALGHLPQSPAATGLLSVTVALLFLEKSRERNRV